MVSAEAPAETFIKIRTACPQKLLRGNGAAQTVAHQGFPRFPKPSGSSRPQVKP
jgi:hypothetical protein